MAYQSGLVAGPNDLLNTLRLFCISQGWTVNRYTASGNGYELCINLGDAFFNFRSYEDDSGIYLNNVPGINNLFGILLNGSDGYSGASDWDRQANYPRLTSPNYPLKNQLSAGIFKSTTTYKACHIFAPSTKVIYVEVEVQLGVFERFGFGSLDLFNPAFADAKSGRFFYGSKSSPYFDLASGMDTGSSPELVPFRLGHSSVASSNSASFLRIKNGSFDNWASSNKTNVSSLTGLAVQGSIVKTHAMRELSLSPLNGSAILYPNRLSVVQSTVSVAPVGMMPDMRFLRMDNYQSGDEFTFGTDTYKVFPWYQKSGYSMQRGIAYKKVV